MGTLISLIIVAALIWGVVSFLNATPEDRARFTYGELNHRMICPHCGAVGQVRTKAVKQKKGISGGKATAALFTGGVSMLATGLSRKESLTEAHCMSCNNTWHF